MYHIPLFAAAFTAAFLINLGITPILIKLSHKYRWYDFIDARKIHPDKISRIGGIGIFIGFFAAAALIMIGCKAKGGYNIFRYEYIPVIIGFFIITMTGLIDDFLNLKATVKIFIQAAAALCISLGGFKLAVIAVPETTAEILLDMILSHGFTIFWIISLCNAINLIDGMDGLAGGISAIGAVFYVIIFSVNGNLTAALLSAALLGTVSAFLIFNFPPAKIFMGDSGSLFLGFFMAVIPLINNKTPVRMTFLIPSLIIFIIPIIDMIVAIIRRKRKKLPVFSPDREHLHHKFLNFGFSVKKILFIIYSFSIFAGIAAVVFIFLSKPGSMILFSAVWILFTAMFIKIHYKNQQRKNEAE